MIVEFIIIGIATVMQGPVEEQAALGWEIN